MSSTTTQIAERQRVQIRAQFERTSSQVSRETKEGRKILLQHFSKLARRTRDRGNFVLRIEGRI